MLIFFSQWTQKFDQKLLNYFDGLRFHRISRMAGARGFILITLFRFRGSRLTFTTNSLL